MKKDEKIIEAKIEGTNKTDAKTIVIIILSIILALILLFKFIDFDFNFSIGKKAELNYTNVNTKIKEGIYITDVSEVVEEVMPSIVSITSKTLISSGKYGPYFWGTERYSEGTGSGIIVSKNDNELLILTNNHVVAGAKELSVQFINEKDFDAEIKGTNERKDIAVIAVKLNKIDNETLKKIKIATLGDSNELKVGNGVIAIGNALGYGQSVTTGVVSALNREVEIDTYKNEMIQIDAAINGGNSGGALLNSKGEVIGINSAKYSSNGFSSEVSIEGMGFAIPISDVKELITSLMNGEDISSGMTLGVEGYVVTKEQSKNYNMPIGFYISKITSNSNAENSELEIGNIITKAEGKKVDDIGDIQDALLKKKKGDSIKLTIAYVDGKEYKDKEIEIKLK